MGNIWDKQTSERMKINNPMFNKLIVEKAQKSLTERRRRLDKVKLNFIKDNITYEQKQIILSSIIADGRLDKIGNRNANFILYHCHKQKDYLFWKADKLVSIFGRYNIYQYKNKNLIQIRFSSNPFFTELHSLIYENSKKRMIPNIVIEGLNELGLAILYLDDGSNHPSGYTISRKNERDKERIKIILNNNNINSSLLCNGVYIKKSESYKLTSILNKFNIPECMKYKIKSTETLKY